LDRRQRCCAKAGGHLATITSEAENAFIYGLASNNIALWHSLPNGCVLGPWLGGTQPTGSSEPGGGWRWVTGETWSYTNWVAYLGSRPVHVHQSHTCVIQITEVVSLEVINRLATDRKS